MKIRAIVVAMLAAVCVIACDGDVTTPTPAPASVSMDFRENAGFFAAPFPSEHRRRAGGGFRLDDYPDPRESDYVRTIVALAQDTNGFGTTSGIFLTTTSALDAASLPSLNESVRPEAAVFLTTADGADAGRTRYPVRFTFRADGSPLEVRNLLAAIPLQGAPLAPSRLHALVVTRRVRDTRGVALNASPTMRALRSNANVPGLDAGAASAYRSALEALSRGGVDLDAIAGITVFRTGNPTDGLRRVAEHALARTPMRIAEAPTRREVFDDFCVYEGALTVTSWQQGELPYTTSGGRWSFSPDGLPTNPHEERARFVITLPRRAMPTGGFPVTVFIRTGGGGDRPLVDRGLRATNGGPAVTPGTGPALELSREGFAGVSWDAPHGGPRNVSRGDEQFLVFNVGNLGGLRDNIRQSALETIQIAHVLDALRIDTSMCAGLVAPGNSARLDVNVMALMGHSMGGFIAPIAAAFEPRYRALVLSGAGGSWIENIVFKERPLVVRPLAEALLGYSGTGLRLDTDDPNLSMLQWALDAADVPPYAVRVAPRHVLMMQGIVDRYIMPTIANATSHSLGLDLAGASLDAREMRLSRFTPLEQLLPLFNLAVRAGAVSGNRSTPMGMFTEVVRQYPEDGVEDGHEVAFQTSAPKRDYRCFLRTFARGVPAVPASDARDCDP